ncbi:MAG: glycosyltransferase family 39 protein [Planctomycetota bacterium]
MGRHRTIRDLLILLGITLILGIYMIANTAVIAKDSVLYIERAQQLPTQFDKISNANEPFGFPALIIASHRLFALFPGSDSNLRWILSGQILVFVCRFVTVGILYLFGKALFDRHRAFWGVLVLIFLPYPAEIGADILRDWPHLLFLFGGLLCLHKGVQKERWGYFLTAGLVSGLGHLIRPECAQIVLYGAVFFVLRLIWAFRSNQSARKSWAYIMLLVGFSATFIPHTIYREKVMPHKLEKLYQRSLVPEGVDDCPSISGHIPLAAASHSAVRGLFGAFYAQFTGHSENLMYYFVLPAAIGFYLLFIKYRDGDRQSQWLIGMLVGFYVLILCLLHVNWGYISRRHVLPLTVLLCFYVPCGIEAMARRLSGRNMEKQDNVRTWFVILMVIGVGVCIPKLLTPIGEDKSHFRTASAWIAENTGSRARIYTFDKRIPFYADRGYRLYSNTRRFKANFKQRYLVALSKDGQLDIPLPEGMILKGTFPDKKGERTVVIYKGRVRATAPGAPIPQK